MKTFITESKKNRILGIAVWLLLWEIAFLIVNQAIYLPSPFNVLKSIVQLISDKNFLIVIFMTTYRVLISFILSAIFGISIGFFCGINKRLYEIFEPIIVLIRSIPVISVIILAIVWFQSSSVPIFSGFLMCFPVIWTNMVEGIKKTDIKLIEMSTVFKIKPFSIFKSVYLPSSLPYIKAGLSTALGLSWKVIAAAEVLSLPKYAIGSKLHDSKVYLETDDLFAWTMMIILLSYIFESILRKIFEKNIRFH